MADVTTENVTTGNLLPFLPNVAVDDQLVVHIPHLPMVCRQLATMGIEPRFEPETNDRLDLALVTVGRKLASGGYESVGDLTPIIASLRDHFAHCYQKWVPTIGKNRLLDGVFALPQPKTQALDDLMSVDGPLPPSALPAAGRGVRVGVLDTRIYAHPDLAGRFLALEQDQFPVPPNAVPQPADSITEPHAAVPQIAGHAVFVASLVLAQAGAATVEARSVLDDKGTATTWDTVRQMVGFADSGVDILNLSLGCVTSDGEPPLLMTRAVEVLGPTMVIVAAAGNHGDIAGEEKAPTWPAALPGVVAVGARKSDGSGITSFTPKVPWLACTAPGELVTGAYLKAYVHTITDDGVNPFTGYAQWSGTSFAAGTVSGAIAARTVPGKVTAREALNLLLDDSASEVEVYVHIDDQDA
jgi:hypothetical protein